MQYYKLYLSSPFVQNQQPGAEEAFKILGHAFEIIGEPVSWAHLILINIERL